MKKKLFRSLLAALSCCFLSISIQAQPLPEGIIIRASAPTEPSPDPLGKPIEVVQPGYIVFFTGKPGEVWCTDVDGTIWYVAHAVALDPTHQRRPMVLSIVVDRLIPAGTRAEAGLDVSKLGKCSPPDGFKGLTLTTR